MAWMMASYKFSDDSIWSKKLLLLLSQIHMTDYHDTMNNWAVDIKHTDGVKASSVDPFHWGLLNQILALKLPASKDYKSYIDKLQKKLANYPDHITQKVSLPYEISSEFRSSVIGIAKGLNLTIDDTKSRNFLGMKMDMVINGKEVMFYDKCHYIYDSHEAKKLVGYTNLLSYHKVKKQILIKNEIPLIEIFKGKWMDLTSDEQKFYLKQILDNSNS